MSDKKSSGCVVAAVVGIAVLVAGGALVATLMYRTVRAGKSLVKEQLEVHRQEEARLAALEAEMNPVELKEDALPEYAVYQPGQPLSREMFLAWKVDQGATTLARDAFREKAEGAEVSWVLRAGDLRDEGGKIVGSFYLPYLMVDADGRGQQTGMEVVRCEFAPGQRDSLLTIRRDKTAEIHGRLSLKTGEVVLLDSRRAGEEVEK